MRNLKGELIQQQELEGSKLAVVKPRRGSAAKNDHGQTIKP